jgi:putative transcriptional regulator
MDEMNNEIRELAAKDFERAMPREQGERTLRSELKRGDDVVALRRFVGLSQRHFADAPGISVRTLRNWEQGRRSPQGPALALLCIAARHPRVLRKNPAAAG